MVNNILQEWRYAWHSYECKHSRPIRVIQGIFIIRVTLAEKSAISIQGDTK